MASKGTAVVTLPADTQIQITREFHAPKHLVYRTLTEPELIKRWWAGDMGETVSAEVDLRVGGRWRYVQQANAGFEVAFHGEYREIVPNERLVCTEAFEGIPEPDANAGLNTYTLSESGGRTTLTILSEYTSKETRDAVIDSGMEGGMQTSMNHLEEVAISLV